MNNQLKITVQPKPTSDKVILLRLIIHYGHKEYSALVKMAMQSKKAIPDIKDRTEFLKKIPAIKNDTGKVYDYKPVRISSGISLPRQFWKNKKATGIHAFKNDQLQTIIDSIHDLYDSMIDEGKEITPELLHNEIKERVIIPFKKSIDIPNKPKDKPIRSTAKVVSAPVQTSKVPTNLITYIDFKVQDWKKGSNPKKKSTLKNYNKFRNWIVTYQTQNKFTFDLLELRDEHIKNFIDWMAEQKKEDGSAYKINYLNFFRKTFKVLVTEARNEDDLTINVNLKKKMFRRMAEQVDDVYLTNDQIELIKKAKYNAKDADIKSAGTSQQMFDWCRDLAVVSSACGYRWSDLQQLAEQADTFKMNKDGLWYFNLSKTKKTDNTALIPCYDQDVVQLYKKYNNQFPVFMQEQTFNETIKTICKLAGLTSIKMQKHKDPITLEHISEKKKLYEMISHRTFRKTFASNLIREYNVPLVIAMSYTTHKTESAFRHYIRLTPEEYYELGVKAMKGRMSIVA